MLTDEQVKFFFQNGYVGPIKVYEEAEAKEILKLIRKKNADQSNMIFMNNVNYDRHFDIPELSRHIANNKIVTSLQSLLGPDIFCWRTEFFPKFPGGAGTEWHQVANYQYANGTPMLEATKEGAEYLDLTVWTTFTEATIENGCMKFLPGSHRKKYYDEAKPIDRSAKQEGRPIESNTGFFGYEFSEFKIDSKWEPSERDAVSLEMKPGECVIFTAKCVHASHPNNTERNTRFAISSRYVPTHVRVYPGQDGFYAHGAQFRLDNYGCVLVSGVDRLNLNRVRSDDVYGNSFEVCK